MDALTLLLIVDMCNREHELSDQFDKPAIYQPYKETYPRIVSPTVAVKNSECFAYRKPAWIKL
jgi:hypothetical protein